MATNMRASGIVRSSVMALEFVWVQEVPYTKGTGLQISTVGVATW